MATEYKVEGRHGDRNKLGGRKVERYVVAWNKKAGADLTCFYDAETLLAIFGSGFACPRTALSYKEAKTMLSGFYGDNRRFASIYKLVKVR